MPICRPGTLAHFTVDTLPDLVFQGKTQRLSPASGSQFALPAHGLSCFFGTPHKKVNRSLLVDAYRGGMLLFGSGLTLIYIGLDQANRLNWLQSGAAAATFFGGFARAATVALTFMKKAPCLPANTKSMEPGTIQKSKLKPKARHEYWRQCLR